MNDTSRVHEVDVRIAAELHKVRTDREFEQKMRLIEAYGEDDYPNKTVIRFEKDHPYGVNDFKTYTYALLKVDGFWYRTGRDCANVPQQLSWEDLVVWLVSGSDPVSVTDFELMTFSGHVTGNHS